MAPNSGYNVSKSDHIAKSDHRKESIMKKLLIIMSMLACVFASTASAKAEYLHLVFKAENGKKYWYENNQRQGVYGDKKNIWDTVYGIERGREIFDPASDAWYWLDAVYNGAAAYNKEVWMPYIYQSDMEKGINKQGKWVRYNNKGEMIKGWYTVQGADAIIYPNQKGNTYYYDKITGEMLKGFHSIDNGVFHFDETTGVKEDFYGNHVYTCYDSKWNKPYEPTLFIYDDASFLFNENLYEGMGEYTGFYAADKESITCYVKYISFSGFAGDNVSIIEFKRLPDGSLQLKSNLCGSVVGDIFSRDN